MMGGGRVGWIIHGALFFLGAFIDFLLLAGHPAEFPWVVFRSLPA